MLLEDILEKAADGICLFHNTPDEPYIRFSHWNHRMKEITGYSIEEINNLGWIQCTSQDPETEQKAFERISGMGEEKDIKAEEWNIVTKDKNIKTLSISTSVLKEENGETHFLAVMQDITERKQNEEKMNRLQAQFVHALEMAQLAFWEYDVSTYTFTFNDYFYKIFGTSVDKVGGYEMGLEEYAQRFIYPDDIPVTRKETRKAIETTDPNFTQKIEHRIKYSDGTIGYMSVKIFIKKDEKGNTIKTYGINQDITERKKMEEELVEATAKYRTIFNQSVEALYVHDTEGRIIDANELACQQTGYSREELLKLNVLDFHVDTAESPKLSRDDVLQSWRKREPGEKTLILAAHRKKDGTVFPVQITSGAAYFDKTKLILAVVQDITDRKETEEDLRRTKERLESLWNITKISDSDIKTICEHILAEVQNITESEYAFFGSLTVDEKTMVMHSWSKETMEACQIPKDSLHFSIDNAGIWANAVKEKRTLIINDYNIDHQGKKGIPGGHVSLTRLMVVPLILNNRVHSIAAVANKPGRYTKEDEMQVESFLRNVQILIDRKRNEEEKNELATRLQQAQKMESIGTLAGGIAHDFNNILSPIILHADMAIEDLPPDDPLQFDMAAILKAAKRAKDLVQQILTFARKKPEEKIILKASIVIKETVMFLRATIPATIDIDYNVRTDEDTILADPVQLNQIVMNLCTNSAYAMKEKGGLLKIIIDNETVSNDKPGMFSDLKPGKYLKLSVEDTGTGIEPDIINKIFEPYYSTKGVGEGTGLGLSIIHGIVKNYGGDIDFKSVPGEGTAFHIYLPLAEVKTTPQFEHSHEPKKGNERILFVDDEKPVVDVNKKLLERFGYTVTTETDSTDALDLFRKDPGAFDLVITDMTMPKMTGIEFSNNIKKTKPDIPVILCTGFSDKIDEKLAARMGIDGFINKPITRNEISHIIRVTLDK